MSAQAQVVWITGASSGIGRCLALHYARLGCTVIASARTLSALDKLATEAQPLAGNIIAAKLDVTDESAAQKLVRQLEKNNTLPTLCILNAGFYEVVKFNQLTTTHFNKTIAINYMGVINCMMAILPALKRRQSGHIAVVSSVAGYAGLPNAAAYGSSKAALINLCESLKHDFQTAGLTLSVVNPGFVKTPMTDKNTFEMPFMISPEQAAVRIERGLKRSSFEITFPRRFTWLIKLLRCLPYPLFFWLTARMT